MRESVRVRHHLLIRPLAVAALCIVGGATACSSESKPVVGVEDASSDASRAEASAGDGDIADADAATTCALPGNFGSIECNACVSTHCCEELAACASEEKCPALQKCVLDCALDSDAGGCRKSCLDTFTTARPKWEAVEQCWFRDGPPNGCIRDCTF
jgi:hypothetical protein